MKTFAKIAAVAGIIVLVILLVINGLQMPEIPEGEEPTKAQAVIIWLKENISTATATLGISFSTLVAFLVGSIQKSSAIAGITAADTLLAVGKTNTDVETLTKQVGGLIEIVEILSKKQNISSKILTDTLLASDMPAQTRAKLSALWDEYLNVEPKKGETEQVTEQPQKTAETAVEPPKTEEKKEETAPIYF